MNLNIKIFTDKNDDDDLFYRQIDLLYSWLKNGTDTDADKLTVLPK